MSSFLVLSEKSWHRDLFYDLASRFPLHHWHLINDRKNLTQDALEVMGVNKIFIPHWSYIIPSEIYSKFECIVFHMTDLPYGRGGSPLQNLIAKGHKDTKISALKVEKGIDTGPIYLKMDLSLHGTAREIFVRSSKIIYHMICSIIEENMSPTPQTGKAIEFKRRKPEDGNISNLKTPSTVYDYIRMLDCEGYPPAFLETENLRFEFRSAILSEPEELDANVRITKK